MTELALEIEKVDLHIFSDNFCHWKLKIKLKL